MRGPRQVPILEIDRLAVAYETRYGDVAAVRDVSLDIHRAETFGIVGESGCGKSTVAFSIVNFLGRNGKITGGRILFQVQDWSNVPRRSYASYAATASPWSTRTRCRRSTPLCSLAIRWPRC